MSKKDYIWNPVTYSCENSKYLANIIDNSVIICDQIIDATKAVPRKMFLTKSNSVNFYILKTFLLMIIS